VVSPAPRAVVVAQQGAPPQAGRAGPDASRPGR